MCRLKRMKEAEGAVQASAADIPVEVRTRLDTAEKLTAEDRAVILDLARNALKEFTARIKPSDPKGATEKGTNPSHKGLVKRPSSSAREEKTSMLTRLRHWWQEIRSSFWFIPAMMVLDAVILATVLITLDATVDLYIVETGGRCSSAPVRLDLAACSPL